MINLTHFYEKEGFYRIDSDNENALSITPHQKHVLLKTRIIPLSFTGSDIKGFKIDSERNTLFFEYTGRGKLENIVVGEIACDIDSVKSWIDTVNVFYSR